MQLAFTSQTECVQTLGAPSNSTVSKTWEPWNLCNFLKSFMKGELIIQRSDVYRRDCNVKYLSLQNITTGNYGYCGLTRVCSLSPDQEYIAINVCGVGNILLYACETPLKVKIKVTLTTLFT